MSSFAALLRFELGRRRHYLLFGATVGLLAVVLPLVVPTGSSDRAATRALAAAGFAFTCLLLGALLGGSGLFADDLAAGRASFGFARPLPAWQLLVARVTAVLAVVLATALLALLPAIAAGAEVLGRAGSIDVVLAAISGTSHAELRPPEHVFRLGALGLAMLGLVGLGNALGLMTKVRGGWLLFDLAAGLALSVALHRAADLLALPGFTGFRHLVLPGALIVAGLGLCVAGAVQLAAGRTDAGRAHRAFSIAWFVAALVLAGATVGYARWYVTPSPLDLELPGLSALERSHGLVEVHGIVERLAPIEARFLVDRESGHVARLEVRGWRGMPDGSAHAAIVDEGRAALWWKRDARSRTHTLHRLDLTASEWQPVATPTQLEGDWVAGTLSPDGTAAWRARTIDGRTIEVAAERTDGAGVLATKRVDLPGFREVRWLGATAESVRLLVLVDASSPWATPQPLVDPAPASDDCREAARYPLGAALAQSLRAVVVEVPAGPGEPSLRPIAVELVSHADYSDILVGGRPDRPTVLLRLGRDGWAIVDAARAEVERCLVLAVDSETPSWSDTPRLLPSGRILLRSTTRTQARWTLLDRSGELLLSFVDTDQAAAWGVAVESGDRILHAYPTRSQTVPAAWSLRILDPERGEVSREGPLRREAMLGRLLGPARSG